MLWRCDELLGIRQWEYYNIKGGRVRKLSKKVLPFCWQFYAFFVRRYLIQIRYMHMYTLDILFSSNHNIHKSLYGLCFWASDLLIDRFYWILSIKGSEVQKQRPHKLLCTLWFNKKSIFIVSTMYYYRKNTQFGF